MVQTAYHAVFTTSQGGLTQALGTIMLNLGDRFKEQVKFAFPEGSYELANSPSAIVKFLPKHHEVGPIAVYDEDGELTIEIGHFTHCHFSPWNYQEESGDAVDAQLCNDLISYLQDIFGDRVVFWGSHASGGGTFEIGASHLSPVMPEGPMFVWSGPWNGA